VQVSATRLLLLCFMHHLVLALSVADRQSAKLCSMALYFEHDICCSSLLRLAGKRDRALLLMVYTTGKLYDSKPITTCRLDPTLQRGTACPF
jgi:hypothetical protein